MPVSLRLPESVKKRVEKRAQAQQTTAHAFMLEAIEEKLCAEEARAAFHAEADRRIAKMKRSGRAIPAGEVFAYLEARAAGRKPARPRARKVA
jgi:predicted transcriptional regulator